MRQHANAGTPTLLHRQRGRANISSAARLPASDRAG
jgi:hypothetical protein